MGEVFRARDTKLNRIVALKVLPESFAADPDRVARFKREAQTLASLNHPHIAQIHGFEDTPQGAALVMEFVEGDDLAMRLKSGPLPVEDALAITRQIAEALEAAHDRGIVHRDLKPANVKVTPDGTVKVLDFGLAKAIAGDNADDGAGVANSPTITTPAMTMRGVILGTAAYMAPEQAKGKPVDRRADIWALGCVLFELLTGVKAFDGEDVTEILGSIVKSEPDWTKLPKDTPPAVPTLLKRCLQKNPRHRLDSAAVIRLELSDMASVPDMPVARPPVQSRNGLLPWVVAGVSILVALAAVSFVVQSNRSRPVPGVIQLELSTPETSSSTTFAISPDAKWLAFVSGPSNRLFVRPIGAISARELPGTDQAEYPFWSPDSRSVAFFSGGQLRRTEIGGGVPRTITNAANARGGSWNRDDVIVFAPSNTSNLLRVSANGGATEPVTQVDGTTSHRQPMFLPDGRHFVYNNVGAGSFSYQIGSIDGSSGATLVTTDNNSGAVYHPSGALLFVQGGSLRALRLNADGLTSSGEVVSVPGIDEMIGNQVSVANDGTVVYRGVSAASNLGLAWRDRSGKLLPPPFDFGGSEPDISQDGRHAAVVRASPEGRGTDIWVIDLARNVPTRLTSDVATELWPNWFPDGGRVLFGKDPRTAIFEQTLAGDRHEFTIKDRKGGTIYPSHVSADGKFVLYRAFSSQGDLWASAVEGSSAPIPVAVSSFDETRGQFSPDVKWVAYESTESGQPDIYVKAFNRPGAPQRISVDGGSEVRWNPNGRELFYIGPNARMMAVAFTADPRGETFEVAAARELFQTHILRRGCQDANYKTQYAVSADGQRFLISETDGGGAVRPLTVMLNWKLQ